MGLKSIEVVASCWLHGHNVEVVEIAGRRWCARCLRGHLTKVGVCQVEMARVDNQDETETMTCRHCGGERHVDDRPCTICGGEV